MPVVDAFGYPQESSTLGWNGNTVAAPLTIATYTGSATQLFYQWVQPLSLALSSATTQCLGVTSLPVTVGAPITVQPCSDVLTQQWIRTYHGAMQIQGLCLDSATGTIAAGAALALEACDGQTQQYWTSSTDFSSTLSWSNSAQTSLCLDTNGTTTTGAPVVLQTCSSAASQMFSVK